MTVKELQTMIVYRFEKNGIGPYVSRTGVINFRRRRKKRGTHKYLSLQQKFYNSIDPKVRDENYSKVHRDKRYMFGCSSKEKLRAYFAGDFKSLFEAGFRIKRYKVPDDKVMDMGLEVAFPVRYHKLQNVRKIKEKSGFF